MMSGLTTLRRLPNGTRARLNPMGARQIGSGSTLPTSRVWV